ncbi:elongation factor 1-alpha [Tanacetum coccineum]
MICCCNKMDGSTPKYSESRFYEIVKKMSAYLSTIGYEPKEIEFVPVSGYDGDNLIEKSINLYWYNGSTLLEALQKLNSPMELVPKPLRLPLQEIYEIEGIGTIAAGRVETGFIRVGMLLRFAPTVFVNDLTPGSVASYAVEDPAMRATSFTSQVFLVNHPGKIKNGCIAEVECHASKVPVKFEKLLSKIDRGSGSEVENEPQYLMNGDVGLVRMVPTKPMVVETISQFPPLGRIVVRDMGEVVVVGVVKSVEKENPD